MAFLTHPSIQLAVLIELATGDQSGHSLDSLLYSAFMHIAMNERLVYSFALLSLPHPSLSREYTCLSLTKSKWHREIDLHVGKKFVFCGNGTANTDHETVWGQSADLPLKMHVISAH